MGWQAAVMAASAAQQYSASKDAGATNAGIMESEGAAAAAGADSNYAARLRRNTELMGADTAAAVQSGGGVGGSTKGVLDQNAVNMELDALNEKYTGTIRRNQFQQQAGFDRTAGDQRATGAALSSVARYLSASNSGGSGWSMGG